jgi:hypothetical protein
VKKVLSTKIIFKFVSFLGHSRKINSDNLLTLNVKYQICSNAKKLCCTICQTIQGMKFCDAKNVVCPIAISRLHEIETPAIQK